MRAGGLATEGMRMEREAGASTAEAILVASAEASEKLQRSGSWRQEAPAILESLGVAAEVSRAYLFENSTRDDGEVLQDLIFEWTAPGIPGTMDDPGNHGYPYSEGWQRLASLLASGEVAAGPTSTFSATERVDLEDEGVLSAALVPVVVEGEWWGYLGFDDCVVAREWSSAEISALRAGASTLGSAIHRERLDEERRNAEAILRSHLEHLPAVTYIEFTDNDSKLGYHEEWVSPQIDELLGYSQDEWLRNEDDPLWMGAEYVHPDDREEMIRTAAETAKSGEHYLAEYRVRHGRTGEWVWIRDEAHLVADDRSPKPYWHGVIVDITEKKKAEEELAKAQALYRAVVENIPAVTYLEEPAEGSGKTIYVSPQITSILGLTPEEWMAWGEDDPWLRMLHPDDRERVVREYDEWRDGGPDIADYRLIRPDGTVVWIRDRGTRIKDETGKLIYDQGFMFDVTDQKVAEEEVRKSQEQYKMLVEQLPAIIYLDPVDENQASLYVSPKVEEILGVSPERWLTDLGWWRGHVHPQDEPTVWSTYVEHRTSGEPLSHEYRMIRDDGRVVWIREEAALLPGEEGKPRLVQGVMYDITQQRQAEEDLAYASQHDSLTGLPNREMFETLLELALARARRGELAVAVLCVDLDNFKLVNESLGHGAGDDLIRELAERIKDATRETDLVARQGGDEFLVLLADIEGGARIAGSDMDNAILTAEAVVTRIQDAFESPFEIAGSEVFVTASIGISLFPTAASDAPSLLRLADSAMHRSKKAGPGGYKILSSDTSEAADQLSMTTRLRKAVDSRVWSLHYQPLVKLDTGRMIGVEALLRWEDPNAGFIPPGEFIPLAEEMGLIVTIGDWVMQELFRQAHAWQERGIELEEISFNISPRQLWQPDLAETVFGHLTENSIDPDRVVIEITESSVMADPERAQHILWDLHGRRLRLAIDDFGTGYSSLSRLKHMPVSILKIDRAFVKDLPDDPDAGRMVSAIIGLAESLEISTLAEGIETAEQRRFLLEKGCTLGQGYYFSRPVPAAGIEEIHARGGITLMVDDLTS
jgi:diguanylate cyclase (GGDEF)-like protein/PAS domain S-box-containing protein